MKAHLQNINYFIEKHCFSLYGLLISNLCYLISIIINKINIFILVPVLIGLFIDILLVIIYEIMYNK